MRRENKMIGIRRGFLLIDLLRVAAMFFVVLLAVCVIKIAAYFGNTGMLAKAPAPADEMACNSDQYEKHLTP